jgi:hypothetical protein
LCAAKNPIPKLFSPAPTSSDAVSGSEQRVFVFKSSGSPTREPKPPPREEVDILRVWLLTPIGAITVWLLALLTMLPGVAFVLFTFPEEYAQFLITGGLWFLLGITVIHWWLPPGDPSTPNAEGLAIAGWHVFVTLMASAVIAWIFLFTGSRPVFSLGDVVPVIVITGIAFIMFALVLTLLRGHLPGRGLRYAWTMLCMLGAWTGLWLVASHAMM